MKPTEKPADRFLRCIMILGLALCSPALPAVQGTDKVAKLMSQLTDIGESARRDRYIRAAGGVAIGGALGTAAIIASQSNNPPSSNQTLVFSIVGGALFLSSAVSFFVPSEFESAPERYRAYAQDAGVNTVAKVIFGESVLQRLSERARYQRRRDGATSLILGSAQLIWYSLDSQASSFLLYQGCALAALGILPFLVESDAETEWRAYQKWKRASSETISFNWSVVPVLNGAALYAGVRF